MVETQKNRIDAMTRQELQNILLDSDLYDADVIDYVKHRLREMSVQSSFYTYDAVTSMPVKVSFSSAYKAFFKNYANFKGRSSRSEYWFVSLSNFLIMLILYILLIPDMLIMFLGEDYNSFLMIEVITVCATFFLYELICLVPSLSLSVRRLHDIGKSGWYLLLGLIPAVGGIVLFVFTLTDSDYSDNLYGKNPKLYPDKVHKNKNKTVLIVILSCLAIVSAVSIYRFTAFVNAHNEAIMNGGNTVNNDFGYTASDILLSTPNIREVKYIFHPNSDGETYKVKWDAVPNIIGYEVEITYYDIFGGGKNIEIVEAPKTEYETAGSLPCTEQIRVRAFSIDKNNDKIYSDWSESRTVNICGGVDNTELNTESEEWEFTDYARDFLGIPDKPSITAIVDEPYYWDAGDCYIVNVSFYENGDLIAAAGCDYDSGEPVRDIYIR